MNNTQGFLDRIIGDYRFWMIIGSLYVGMVIQAILGDAGAFIVLIPVVVAILWKVIPQKNKVGQTRRYAVLGPREASMTTNTRREIETNFQMDSNWDQEKLPA